MTPVELILSRLPGAKRSGNGWEARCPAHDDSQPSLSISDGDDGRALVCCHAGCTAEAITAALRLKLEDLMPSRSLTPPTQTIPSNRAENGRFCQSGSPRDLKAYLTAESAIKVLERQHGKLSAAWTYQDDQGQSVGVVIRWNLPGGGKDIRPVSRKGDGWIIGGMLEPRPLYRLPELLARPHDRVYVTEGEKAAEAARSIGLLATTSPHGSKSAAKANWSILAGREVVILPDNDDPGRQYAKDVAGILATFNPPAKVKIVELPGLPEHGDIVDWVEARDAVESVVLCEQVRRLADVAPLLNKNLPRIAQPGGRYDSAQAEVEPILICLADVEPVEVRWLWPGRIPLGRIALLVGRPDEGKSFLTTYMAARISTGSPWPDGAECPKGSVILISAEDDPADTIRPRLDAHHADAHQVHMLSSVRRVDGRGKKQEVMFTLADVDALAEALQAHPDCKLVVVDPVGSFLGGRTDAHRDNEVRSVLAPVARLAEKHGAAVVVVAHRRKSGGGVADDLALGSRAFTGIARAVWHLTHDEQNRKRRLLLPGKNNLSRGGDGLAFKICGEPPAISWERDPIHMTADDALAVENGQNNKPGPAPEARSQAVDWLVDLLKAGRMEAAKIQAEAKAAGYSWRTVHRAKDELGIKPYREQFGGAWVWRLPAGPANQDPSCHIPENKENLASWHLWENARENADSDMPESLSCQVDEPGTIGTDEDQEHAIEEPRQ